MEILSSVFAKVVELTVDPIVRQVGYLLCYRNNFKELKNQVEELQTTKERIDHQVEAERRNGRNIESDVFKWQASVIKTLEEAKKLCEDPCDAKGGCSKWSFPNLKSRHQRSRKAMKMANTIIEMKGKGNFDKGVGYVPHLDIINNLPATRGSDELESRNLVKEGIMLSLKDPKVSKIGVYGIGGVGKTTLVKEVAKQVKEDKLFDEVVIVTISQTNLKTIQDEIAEQLGLHLEEKTSSIGRANCLCERIKKEKAVLILLDDLQEKIDLDKLGIPSLDASEKNDLENVGVPLKNDYKGCKLLLTSRSEDILEKNDTEKNFSLQVLNVEESWSLFEAMVGDVVKDDDFRTIATQVAQRCVGLPVLIVTIAKSLKYNKNIYYWKDTLNNLKSVDNKGMRDTIFSALEFNFNRLEDEVKKVFLLSGVNGTSILLSDLLKYVIGLGIFKHINDIEHARNRLYRIIDDLKKSCLLVDHDARTEMAKMHDIVHEVAISIASKYAFSKLNAKWKDWQRNDIPESCTQIILEHCFIQKLPEMLDYPHLTFLRINSNDNRTLKIPDLFFKGVGNLEALDLTGMIITSLPISFNSLTKLKTLCLDFCSLKDISGIGALLNLEILSLFRSSIERFPSEIEQLTKLRMLDLRKSGIGSTLPNILYKLTKIEELYMGDASINWEVASLAKLGHLTGLTTLELQIREASLLPKDIPFDKLERYKVVIGEKWEWLGNEGTSRLLKVKLDTNIHWEWGIKTLIESVEDLYLDKIIGISNVLFELNGKGFPLLKHLHLQNNDEILHIVNSAETNQTHVLFPKLETLILHNLNSLVKICHGPIMGNLFCKLKVLKVRSCNQLVYLFPLSMIKACSQLVEIQVSECSSMKRIVYIESSDKGNSIDDKIEFLPLRSLTLQHLPTIDDFCSNELRANVPSPFFSAKVKFDNLETLKLCSMTLKNIWDDNQSSVPYLIHNLANLTVEDCSGLKYLLSSSIVGRLSNLKQLEVSKCDMMEEIIATEEISGAAQGEVLFPKLETILIKDMQNLKTIWHLILASNSLACFKTLEVKNCEKIEEIFPEYMNGAFASLETLKVEDCKSVKEIFQLDVNAEDTTLLKYITLLRLPQLKQIWSRSSQSSLHFKNLQVVRVEDCEDLEYLFPFSIAMQLPQLEAITINNAKGMKEIVFEREEPLDNLVRFEFNRLTSITLGNLQDLQGFCAGNHSLSCSSLKTLDVCNCQKLKLFKKQDTSRQGRLSDVHVSTQQPLFTLEEVIHNLENLHLSNEDASMIFQSQVPRDQFRKLKYLRLSELEDAQDTTPYWFLQNISSLEFLSIVRNSIKVIFPHKMPQDENGEIEIKTRLKKLALYKMDELQHICKEKCQLDPVLDALEYLYVKECSNLKHLVPSSITFNHLTYLEVQKCSGLIYLITSLTARSLVNLTTMKIRGCDLIERILEEEEGECNNEIEFSMLEVLELESLPQLNSFGSINCSLKLPLLEELVIRQCPRMRTFATTGTSSPLLREILTDEKDEKWFCDSDLNSTVNKIFQQMVAFRCMERLELSQYPELGGDVWYSHVMHGMFGNLKILVIHKCDFLSRVLLPLNLLKELSKLEELEVRECNSLEALFELPNMNEGGMVEKVIIHLKRMDLFGLPQLKHIWKQNSPKIISSKNFGEITSDNNIGLHTSQIQGFTETTEGGDIHHQSPMYSITQLKQSWSMDPQESLHFCKLEVVIVENCYALEYLFPFSMVTAMLQLEQIIIKHAVKMKEIVFVKDESLDCPPKFDFNRLSSLVLWGLPELQRFCSRSHSLQCPSLKILDVRNCLKWSLFNKHGTIRRGKVLDGNLQVSIQQLTFPLNEVSCNLERLALNYEDACAIVEGQFSGKQFCKLKFLVLSHFEDEQARFPYWFLKNVISVERLLVEISSFKEIFQHQGQNEIQTRVKFLTLKRLHELDYMCKEGCKIDPVLEVLESLTVNTCSNLKNLVPSSATFNHLTYLEVQNCKGLIYLITSSTARSLVNLTTMKIRGCDLIERILEEEGGESNNVIELSVLKVLELESLPQLNSFGSINCSLKLPLLKKLVIKKCPRMKTFAISGTSSPLLREILTDEKDGKWFCDGDLNSTVNKIFQQMVAFRCMERLELSQYPELGDLWYSHVKHGMFGNLKILVVHKCDFLSRILLPLNLLKELPKLEELEVRDCNSLEALFELSNMNEGGMVEKLITHLKRMDLFGLPQLKHIWKQKSPEIVGSEKFGEITSDNSIGLHTSQIQGFKETTEEGDIHHQLPTYSITQLKQSWSMDPQESLRFCKLEVVRVENCYALEYLFPFSMATGMLQLEQIIIKYAVKMKEIVLVKEESLDCPPKFEFNHLSSLVLWGLPELQGFCSRSHNLQCPSLKILDVRNCLKWSLFNKHGTTSRGKVLDRNIQVSMEQLTFPLHEVSRNLEQLALNYEDACAIIEGQFSGEQLCKLKFLVLSNFEDEQARFPYWFLQNVISLERLLVEISSFKEIFQHQGQKEIQTRVKFLTLNRLHELEYMCKEGCKIDPVLEVLESLAVNTCSNLKNLVPSSATFNHLTYLEVQNCRGLIYLITSSTARSLVNLTTMKIRGCNLIEIILDEEREESNNEIELSVLNVLELESLPQLNSFGSSDCSLKLPLLKKLVIKKCPRMKTFATSGTSSPLLREILTDEKDGKWFCDGDLNSTVNKIFQQMVAFRCMEHLELSQYPELGGDVWYSHVKHGLFGNLKILVLHKCDFLSRVLLPLNLLKELPKLEELEVRECNSLEALFELPNMNEGGMVERVIIHLKRLDLFGLPELKHIWKQNSPKIVSSENFGEITSDNSIGLHTSQIQGLKETTEEGDIHHQPPTYSITQLKQSWSMDPQESLRFCKLEVVRVENCYALEYLFPFSIATGLLQLEQIIIKYTMKMKEIVFVKEESLDCPPKFEFNRLSSLVLWGLPELQGFCSKSHSLHCPSLKILDVRNCLKWSLCNKHGNSGRGKVIDHNLQVSMQQLTFPLNEVSRNLEQLALNKEDACAIVEGQFSGKQFSKLKFLVLSNFEDEQARFPYWFLQNAISLERLLIEISSFKEIFQHQGQNGIQTRVKFLTLNRLHELEYMCKEGCKIDPVLEVLESLAVNTCSNLKNLVPSSATFNHLTYLEVQNCRGLIYLITSSTARSLVNLTTIKIRACDSIEEIVAEEGGESISEIVCNRLEVLELESLPKLKLFSSCNCILKLPWLNKLVIRQCPRMKSFSMSKTSAPKLCKIQTDKQDGRWCWEGDLNRTVDKIFLDMVAFRSFNHLELSIYPELEELWYGQVGGTILCNLKHLVVRKCTFLSNVLFSSNLLQLLFTLEELEVAGCDSLEAVFDVKALDDKAIESKEVSGLKKLTLSGLPKLKQIWNREAGKTISYGNLQIVKVDKCQHLKNLFSVSLCQDMKQLEVLHIESCGVEEIVSVEEGLEELKFDFPYLTSLMLLNLMRLKNFYPKRHVLECPSLKELNVRGCEGLEIFQFDHLNSQQLRESDVDLQIKQALFYIEKVSHNLEQLPLSEKDTMTILNGNYEKYLFQSIKVIRLQYFLKTPMKFLNDLIHKFPGTTLLQVRCSSFETLFPLEEIGHCCIESPTQIKRLWLFHMEQLEHIWNVDDDLASHPLVQNLEDLLIRECPRLIRLAPPFASFKSLTSLEVKDCDGLMYFMTSHTARSLVHLTSLQVSNCGMLEEAVMIYEGQSEEEITFQSLKYLELNCLSGFKCFCSGKHTKFIFPSLVTLKVIGCHKMQNFSHGVIIASFLKLLEVENGKKHWKGDLNTTIKQLFINKENGEGVKGDYKGSSRINVQSSQTHQKSVTTIGALSSEEHRAKSKADQIVDSRKQEIHKLPFSHAGNNTQKIYEIVETPLGQSSQHTLSLTKDDAAIESSPSQAPEAVASSNQDEGTGTKEMHQTIHKPLDQNVEDMLIPVSVQNIAIGTRVSHESIDKPFVQATQNAWDITLIQNKEEAYDSDIHLSKNLFNHIITSTISNYEETVGTQETYKSKGRISVRDAQNILSPTMVYDREMNGAIEKSLIQTTQEVQSPTTIHDIEESQGSEACPRENSSNQSTTFVIGDNPKPESSYSSPSKAPEPAMTSSILESDAYSAYKWLIDISQQNSPYLDAGAKRHPQVLDWFNTKPRRRVFATIFTEVTRILRTTRLRDLTKDDRNYIRECCAALEAVGFDASWLSYVYKCIERCVDGDELKRKREETEVKASTLRNELASVEASLALLRDEESRLDNFIES